MATKKYSMTVRDKSTGRLLTIPLMTTSDGSLTVDPSREASYIIDEDIIPLKSGQAATSGSVGISDLHATSRADGAQQYVGNIIIVDQVEVIIMDVVVQ